MIELINLLMAVVGGLAVALVIHGVFNHYEE
jgi:hypothetical protein